MLNQTNYQFNQEYNNILFIASKVHITIEEYEKLNTYDKSLCETFDPSYKVVPTTNVPISRGGDFESIINGYYSFDNELKFQKIRDAKMKALEEGIIDWHDKC